MVIKADAFFFYSPCYMVSAILSTLNTFQYLIFPTTLEDREHYYSHFTCKEGKELGKVT